MSRTVAESQAERSEIIFPADSNALGNLFGGRLMQFIDLVGAVAAVRHSRAIVVSASMDHLDFVAPVHIGDLLILKASVNRAFRTSMEVGVRAMVEDARAGTLRHVSSAYVTYVAVDREDGKPVPVPCVIAETEHQKRRYADAGRRRENAQRARLSGQGRCGRRWEADGMCEVQVLVSKFRFSVTRCDYGKIRKSPSQNDEERQGVKDNASGGLRR